MARVSGNVIGNFKGRLGNLSARIVEGDTILSARPSSFNVSQAPASVEARQKFAVSGSFAKNILGIPILEAIWKEVKLSGMSIYNTVFKKNYDYVAVDKPTIDNIITPQGFSLPVTSAVLSANNLAVELNALDTSAVISADEKNLTLASLVVFHNPLSSDDEAFKIIKLSKDEVNFSFDSAYTITINLDVTQKAVAAKYQNKILYIAVATKTIDGKVVQYSATYANQS